MPLIIEKQVSAAQTVGVWRIEESIDTLLNLTELSTEEQARFELFKADSRKKEWLAARRMLFEITGKWHTISYYENGQPYLSDSSQSISFSHTKGYAALSLQNEKGAGIDIQVISPKINKIKQRFLSPTEWENYSQLEESDKYLHVIWSAKEALYKIHGDNKVFFKEHMTVHNIDKLLGNGFLKADVLFGNRKESHSLTYQEIENCMLVYISNS